MPINIKKYKKKSKFEYIKNEKATTSKINEVKILFVSSDDIKYSQNFF